MVEPESSALVWGPSSRLRKFGAGWILLGLATELVCVLRLWVQHEDVWTRDLGSMIGGLGMVAGGIGYLLRHRVEFDRRVLTVRSLRHTERYPVELIAKAKPGSSAVWLDLEDGQFIRIRTMDPAQTDEVVQSVVEALDQVHREHGGGRLPMPSTEVLTRLRRQYLRRVVMSGCENTYWATVVVLIVWGSAQR